MQPGGGSHRRNVTTAAGRPVAWRSLLYTALRVVGSTVVVVTLYYAAPLDRRFGLSALAVLVLVLAVLLAVAVVQVIGIVRSPEPGIRAVEALAVSIPLLLVSFASIHFLIEESNPASFSEPLTRTDALYFTVTVLATVGFGDISPVTEGARLVVTVQMIVNLLVLGIGLRVIVGAVRVAKERRPRPDADQDEGAGIMPSR